MRSDREAKCKREEPEAWPGPGHGGAEGAIPARPALYAPPLFTSKLPDGNQLQERRTAGMRHRVPWLTLAVRLRVPGAAALGGGPALLEAVFARRQRWQ